MRCAFTLLGRRDLEEEVAEEVSESSCRCIRWCLCLDFSVSEESVGSSSSLSPSCPLCLREEEEAFVAVLFGFDFPFVVEVGFVVLLLCLSLVLSDSLPDFVLCSLPLLDRKSVV